ncbi:hypothetical protein B0H16DRAFT_1512604 [Mycena metata]|uniref:Uncharacterized protein n=1 Tax=Mycena metata TaxID=1033252 RepID=A0AAD7JJK2_9AGAR|nr:hypothetical protein B0H16DRAFT_1525479 [Mycena metata]KAJ7772199.1 hypothetical protein B0H16DRAFT_1512604 [Mycena metata]
MRSALPQVLEVFVVAATNGNWVATHLTVFPSVFFDVRHPCQITPQMMPRCTSLLWGKSTTRSVIHFHSILLLSVDMFLFCPLDRLHRSMISF